MRPVALNVFQRTQRAWDQAHPYNAAQCMGLPHYFSAEQITNAFEMAVADLRLGTFHVTGEKFFVDALQRPITFIDEPDLPALLSREMNRPFAADHTFPLRPFLSRDTDGATLAGVVYQHWVGDSVSIRLIMRQWLLRLTGGGGDAPVRFEHGTLQRRFGPGAGGWSVVAHAAELMAFARSMKRVRRVPQLTTETHVRVLMRRAPAGLIDRLAARCRRDGCTVGDAFLAAVALACDRHGPAVASTRRPDLALGTIVDLRSRRRHVPDDLFGLYLGFMVSTFRDDQLGDFTLALHAARRLRLLQNGRRSAEASQLRMGIGLLAARRMRPATLRDFYRKRLPLSGGLSNVNLNRDPLADYAPLVLKSYWRVSPTGPLLPLVLTPTTLGNELTLCCTWQQAVIDQKAVSELVDYLFSTLSDYASS